MDEETSVPEHTGANRQAATRQFDKAPLSVAILLWPSFPLMSLAGLVESLRHAGDHGDDSQQRYARWDILGGPGRTTSSCGIEVEATAAYPSATRYDYVFVIGGLLRDLATAPEAHRHYIRAAHAAERPVIGVCTGNFVLAEEGLLDGRAACVHPYHARDFAARFPALRRVGDRDYVTSGTVTTVMGGVAILPVMTRIIGAHFGPDRSAKTIHQMTVPTAPGLAGLEPLRWARSEEITDPRIQRALVMLDAQATQNPSIADLARSLGLSERHFLRLFRTQVGRAPKDYLLDMKLRTAVWMLRQTTRSITEIAYDTGFASGANFADHCRKRLNATPTQIRHAAVAPV